MILMWQMPLRTWKLVCEKILLVRMLRMMKMKMTRMMISTGLKIVPIADYIGRPDWTAMPD